MLRNTLLPQYLTDKALDELECRAKECLSHKQKQAHYMLARPEIILSMIDEIRDLRKLADPQALTAAYFLGKETK